MASVSGERHRRGLGLSIGDVGRLPELAHPTSSRRDATSRRRLAVALAASLLIHASALAISVRLAPSTASPTEPPSALIRPGPASVAARTGASAVSLTLRIAPDSPKPESERSTSPDPVPPQQQVEPDPTEPDPTEPEPTEPEPTHPESAEPDPIGPREIEWRRPVAGPVEVSQPANVSEPLRESVASLPPAAQPDDRAAEPSRQSQTPEIGDLRRRRDAHRVRRSEPPTEAMVQASEPANEIEPAAEITPEPLDPSSAIGAADADTVTAAGRRDPPRPLATNEPPLYPPSAVNRRWEGTTRLGVSVDATGRVTRVEIRQSSGHAILDRAARDAVARWRFEAAPPAAGSGEQTVLVPVRFQLDRVY